MHHTSSDQDWLVQLIHAPIGSVVTSGASAAAEPEPQSEAGPDGVQAPDDQLQQGEAGTEAHSGGDVVEALPLDAIRPNPAQPRRSFDEGELQALAESIAQQGVIQPIVVRPLSDADGAFQIVAGERRWRAARLAGLATIPALVRALTDERTSEVALVENIQRTDLPALDEARAYQLLIDRHGLTQDEIAHRLGKNRTHIAHMLRLQRLPEAVQQMMNDGALSIGHARVLVNVADPETLARRVVAEGLTVRQTEDAAKNARNQQPAAGTPTPAAHTASPDHEAWAARFGALLQRPVTVKAGRKGGSLVIRYDSDADLAAILAKIGG